MTLYEKLVDSCKAIINSEDKEQIVNTLNEMKHTAELNQAFIDARIIDCLIPMAEALPEGLEEFRKRILATANYAWLGDLKE